MSQPSQMHWEQLINDTRLGLENYSDPKKGLGRSDFRRDYDRLIFSSPFRRLQNKTQVFPLPGSIFVHNRLTHSLEVSSVGKSMAELISAELQQKYAGQPCQQALTNLGDIVAAACLAHDLGNPPFGHSGEKTISAFFKEGAGAVLKDQLPEAQWSDFTKFDGNANAFRVLTHQFNGRRHGGFAMTYSMLASIVKYPYDSSHAGHKSKFGFFCGEKEHFVTVADKLGMLRIPQADDSVVYARHPFVYIVEAADDICYEVMDMEDAHKLKILTTPEVIDAFMAFFPEERRAHLSKVMQNISDPNEQIGYLRSCVIGRLVDICAEIFMENEGEILRGKLEGSLINKLPMMESQAYAHCNAISWSRIYKAPEVVEIDLAGNRIITYLLDKLTHAVTKPDLYYSRLLLSQVPQQYDVHAPKLYDRILSVIDHISGMTDVYALNLYRKLRGHSLPAV